MDQDRLFEVHRRLQKEHGTPDLGNVQDVFGELIFALLSTRTSPDNYQDAFAQLRAAYPDWKDLSQARQQDLASLLRPCGLQNRKASAICDIAERVFVAQGREDLEHLRNRTTEQARKYLESLPHVGVKVAKCVLLYALGRPVFPLDAHNLRVLRRIGLIDSGGSARSLAEDVEESIPAEIRHDLHVNLVAHGRATCHSSPECGSCVLDDLCEKVGVN